ncbi:hypothetical protein [Corallococcus exiguus]|uniref:hypothetical protein n=1 Tax=Corallococcus exiguus TaxID=83462 RepID=UPI003DA2C355
MGTGSTLVSGTYSGCFWNSSRRSWGTGSGSTSIRGGGSWRNDTPRSTRAMGVPGVRPRPGPASACSSRPSDSGMRPPPSTSTAGWFMSDAKAAFTASSPRSPWPAVVNPAPRRTSSICPEAPGAESGMRERSSTPASSAGLRNPTCVPMAARARTRMPASRPSTAALPMGSPTPRSMERSTGCSSRRDKSPRRACISGVPRPCEASGVRPRGAGSSPCCHNTTGTCAPTSSHGSTP